jgi:hypothetical protein
MSTIYVYCVYTAMSCMHNIVLFKGKIAKTMGILIVFLIGCLQNGPRSLVSRGGSRGGSALPPLKLEKIRFFGTKSWFFTRNTPKIFAPPSARCNWFRFWWNILCQNAVEIHDSPHGNKQSCKVIRKLPCKMLEEFCICTEGTMDRQNENNTWYCPLRWGGDIIIWWE